LLKFTGQFAHVGLGRKHGKPIVYIDADLDAEDKALVLAHEYSHIEKWQNLQRLLNIDSPADMRAWIKTYIDAQDPSLANTNTQG